MEIWVKMKNNATELHWLEYFLPELSSEMEHKNEERTRKEKNRLHWEWGLIALHMPCSRARHQPNNSYRIRGANLRFES